MVKPSNIAGTNTWGRINHREIINFQNTFHVFFPFNKRALHRKERGNLQHLPGQSPEGKRIKRVASHILGVTRQVFWLQVPAR